MNIPLFYKDRKGKWHIVPIHLLEQMDDGRWFMPMRAAAFNDVLTKILLERGDILWYSPILDGYVLDVETFNAATAVGEEPKDQEIRIFPFR